jgi:uncharacterized UPF0160 family protein
MSNTAVTHNGTFHADDLVAAAMGIKAGKFTPEEIVRTRDPQTIEGASFVFDVGGKYAPETNRFDHHQPGGAGVRENGVPYASAGLVWRTYGEGIVAPVAKLVGVPTDTLAEAVDQGFVQAVDAHDTGSIAGGFSLKGTSEQLRMPSLSSILGSLNPVSGLEEQSPAALDASFKQATQIASTLLDRAILIEASRLQGLAEIRKAYRPGESILVLDRNVPDWQSVVCTEMPGVNFVITPRTDGGWSCTAVPPSVIDLMSQRKPLPEAWAGLTGDDLQKVTQVETAVFCHTGRFMCSAKTREDAIRLARLADSEA